MFEEHEKTARDLRAFLAIPQNPAWIYDAAKPIKRVIYCLNGLANSPFFLSSLLVFQFVFTAFTRKQVLLVV